MRNFDNWIRYQDNDRNPLHGCIQFNVKDGNTVAPIYDSDGTPLANPQVTDTYGRTKHQVFVDTDVAAYFYKYIGQGVWSGETDIDTSDVSKWALQYTSESILNVLSNIQSDTAVAIENIAALRAVNVDDVPDVNEQKVITLMGYFEQGDKEPINYIWNPESTEQDNGGSVIKSDNLITGRWIMVQPTEHVDSRHFGAFPSNSMNMDDQTYQIGQLFAYCSNRSLRPFFNGSTDYRWFKFTNLNVNASAIDISEGTRFMDLGNNTINGEWNGDPFFNLSNTNVVAKNVKTSWMAKSYTGYKNVLIDRVSSQKNWQDANVTITYSPCYGYNFNHCVLSENANIGSDNEHNVNNTFINCKLNERMFITSGDYTVSLAGLTQGCQVDMDDFRNNMWLYKEIRQTSDTDSFFDYRNFPNVGKPIVNYVANAIQANTIWVTNLKNVMNTMYALDSLGGQVTTYYLENCVGYYSVPANVNIVAINSTLKLRPNTNTSFNIQGGSVEFDEYWSDNATINSVQLLNTTLNAPSANIYTITNFGSRNSTVNAKLDVTASAAYYNTVISQDQQCAYADVKDCNIGTSFLLYGITGEDIQFPIYNELGEQTEVLHTTRYVNGTFKDNFVSGQIVLGADNENSHYTANWLARGLSITNNTGLVPNPIAINRGASTHYEQYNIYEYKANKGTFPGHHSFTINYSGESRYQSLGTDAGGIQLCWVGKIDNWIEPHTGETGHTDPSIYLTEFTMFSIGTLGVRFKASTYCGSEAIMPTGSNPGKLRIPVIGNTTVLSEIERSYQEYYSDAQTQTPWPKDLCWVGDMNWRITCWYGIITICSVEASFLNYLGPVEIDFEPISAWPLAN